MERKRVIWVCEIAKVGISFLGIDIHSSLNSLTPEKNKNIRQIRKCHPNKIGSVLPLNHDILNLNYRVAALTILKYFN